MTQVLCCHITQPLSLHSDTVEHPHCTTTQTESGCIIQTLMLPLCNTIGLMLLLYLGWELCVVIIIDQYCLLYFLCQPNSPKLRGEYFAIQTLFAQVALGDYNTIVHEKHALHITQVCIPYSGDIISNLLLSRVYFPHLFHIISAKTKKSFSFTQKTFKKWPLLVGRLFAITPKVRG